MKQLLYRLYALFFCLGRLLPAKENGVALISPHHADFHDSLGEVKAALEEKGGYDILLIRGSDIRGGFHVKNMFRFFAVQPIKLARVKYIFLNDNFNPLAFCPLRRSTVVTQLWHGEGALKKIGLSLQLPPEIEAVERKLYRKYTYAVSSSEDVRFVHQAAFDLPKERVLPLGSPRTDSFFRPFDTAGERQKFDAAYPQCKGKKLVLYAPTFRDDARADGELLSRFDGEAFREKFGGEYVLLVRLHPQVHGTGRVEGAVDVTDYPDIGTLLHLSDILITDYSSVFMDFVLLKKPCFFYAFDVEEYRKNRDFYGDYESTVPGPVARDFSELLRLLENPRADEERQEAFCRYHLGACDGGATSRVLREVMGIS